MSPLLVQLSSINITFITINDSFLTFLTFWKPLKCFKMATLGPEFWDDHQKITEADNTALTLHFSEEEIKTALFSSGATKAPGPDDDTVIFCSAEKEVVQAIKWAFLAFEAVAGMKINFAKCEMYPINVGTDHVNDLAQVFGCQVNEFPIRYLGVPIHWKNLKKTDWYTVMEKYQKKLQGWSGNMLSYGGKVTLINSVLSSLVLYMLAFHSIPKGVLKNIDKIRSNFLWHAGDKKRYHLVKWRVVCQPKKMGGLGIKDLQLMNDALLCKWGWKFRDSTYTGWWKDIVKIKYSNNNNRQKWSPFWKSLKRLEQVVNAQCRYTVGDGRGVKFWEDVWIGDCALNTKYPSLYNICLDKHCTVAQTVQIGVAHWRFSRQLSEMNSIALNELYFLVNNISLKAAPDILVWGNKPNGTFSVKDVYNRLVHRDVFDSSCAHIWEIKVPSKIQIFLWLMCKDRLLTRDNLALRGWEGDVSCVFCRSLETIDHVFFKCSQVKPLWKWFLQQFGIATVPSSVVDLFDLLSSIDGQCHHAIKICWCAILWTVWLARNECCFQHTRHGSLRMGGMKINALLLYWTDLWDPILKSQVMQMMPAIELLPMQLTTEEDQLLNDG
ncbi:RNA-directed DNA polymerase (reverse transcriptase)-related family protein [Rhynchospora pubera]|uniref:RNA-directed DNA polymerase (Reverse transcriptase)-related family protein n=1 Tax=Rhynchospora pubera TaxID=906938 RepID=A0AAV8CSR0_9POAL|nr:RNA-directed DNA polymerase (reverse transcriptase)-related family protein [Rhynchospora pubera]